MASSSLTTDSKALSRRVTALEEDSIPAMESRIGDLEAKVAEIPALLARIAELEARPVSGKEVTVSRKGAVGRPKKETLPAPPLPEGEEAPGPEAYRLAEADIKEGVCIARVLTETNKDIRWSVAIYNEAQCGAAVEDGEELCAGCAEKAARYEEDKKYRKWHGTVHEEPLSWMHMLGTAWATQAMEGGKLRWLGAEAAVGGAGTADSSSMVSSDSGSKMSVAEKRAALKAEKDAKKAEEKAAKTAAAEAKKAAAAEAKAAKVAAAAEEKAKKAAEKAAKPPKATKKTSAGAASKAAEEEETDTAPARADTSATVTKVKGSVEPIGDELYWREGCRMYEYDMDSGKGAFLGMLEADGETITPCDKEPEDDEE